MQFRTDLALERQEALTAPCRGVRSDHIDVGPASITRIEVLDEEGEMSSPGSSHRPLCHCGDASLFGRYQHG